MGNWFSNEQDDQENKFPTDEELEKKSPPPPELELTKGLLLYGSDSQPIVVQSVDVPKELRNTDTVFLFSGIVLSPPESSVLHIRSDVKGKIKCILSGNLVTDTFNNTGNQHVTFNLRYSIEPNTYYSLTILYKMQLEYQLKLEYRFDTDKGYYRELKHTYHLSPPISLVTETFENVNKRSCVSSQKRSTQELFVGIVCILLIIHIIRNK